MSKYRRAAKVDVSQPGIVKSLRAIPGVSVALGHDDILVGYKGRTYWFEVKSPHVVSKKTGAIRESAKKDSQKDLLSSWEGHYEIVWNVDQVLAAISLHY